jgi:hypothetical protein
MKGLMFNGQVSEVKNLALVVISHLLFIIYYLNK